MLVYVYMCFLLYILSTSFVLTPFLRGLHSMPAGTDVQGSGPQLRIWYRCCSAPLFRSSILVYSFVLYHTVLLGYDGGPVPSFDSVCVCLEVCGHVVCVGPYIWSVCHLYMLDCETKPPTWLLSVYVLLLGGRTAAVTLLARVYICFMCSVILWVRCYFLFQVASH